MQVPEAAAEARKDAGAESVAAEDEPDVPTPLRVRRSSSPAPVTPLNRSATSERSQRLATQGSQAIAEAGRQLPGQQRIGLLAGLAMLAFALLVGFWPKLVHDGHARSSLSEDGPSPGGHQASVPPIAEPELEEGPALPSLVSKALGCPGARSDVLDVLAGAPYEFSGDGLQGQAFYRLPRLAAAAAKASSESAASEEEFSKAVLQMAATGGGWPPAFQARLLAALKAACEAKPICDTAQSPLDMEVDNEFTSERARSSGALHQAFLRLGEMTRVPFLRARAEAYRSLPPSVVLSADPITQMRDCFAVRGANASLALRLSQGSSSVRQLVIEQPSRVAAIRPGSMPHRFSIYGAPAEKEVDGHENPYTELLGKFEYAAAAPAVQAFELMPSGFVKGLRLVFEGSVVEENYICLYRVKAFEDTGPACSGERVATAMAK